MLPYSHTQGVWINLCGVQTPPKIICSHRQVATWWRTMGLRNYSFSFLEGHWCFLPEVQYKKMRPTCQPIGRLAICPGLSFLICVIRLVTIMQHLPEDSTVDCRKSSCSKPGSIKSHIGTIMTWKGLKEAEHTTENFHGTHGVSLRESFRDRP